MSGWNRLLSILSVLATGFVGGLATPPTRRWNRTMVKHSWNTVPEAWETLGHPPADTTIDLFLKMKPQDENALVDVLREVSDPRHAKYGAYLSKGQVTKLVAPHPETLNLVHSWLKDHGIPPSSVSMTLGGDWLMVVGVPVSKANVILGASYQLYQHVEVNDTVLRTVSYSLPEVLHEHIKTVVPTTFFGSPRTQWMKPRIRPRGTAAARTKAGSEELVENKKNPVTPSYLRGLYKTMGYVPAAVDQNAIATVGYAGEYPNPQDLTAFMTEYRTDGEYATFTVELVNGGGYDPNDPGFEANLGIQYAEAFTYPTKNIFYSTGGVLNTATDPYLNWLAYMLDLEDIPPTISTSYGGPEYSAPLEYAYAICDEFLKLGALGVSVIFSSGDWGVGRGHCLVRNSDGQFSVQFLPEFPASCPWVTSVGGTTDDDPEIAASLSGGGFSNYFPRPYYQDVAVPLFLEDVGDIYDGLFNPHGRGIPDISAQALNFKIVVNGEPEDMDGTSCSTPTVAGIISLLNDYRISKGKQPLGFLNPWLYSFGLAGLNDITFGSNPGCRTDGFPAIDGWDPVRPAGFVSLHFDVG
ncbi:subtilisin-like protein [Lactarius indigo]|nr:subtilisin-like protein [Lactarius indigo]